MIDLQLCCVSIQRNKLEFGIILSSYIIMRTVPVTLLFQFIRLLHCSHCIRSVLWASECERSRFRLHFVRFLYYLSASLFLMIFHLFAFIHSPRFFSESDLRELVFSFHQKENKHKHFCCCCCLPSSFMYFVIHPNCLRSWNVIRKMCTK